MKICEKCGERHFKPPPDNKCKCGHKYVTAQRQRQSGPMNMDGSGNKRAFDPSAQFKIDES